MYVDLERFRYETSWGSTVVRPATNVKSALTPHIRMFEPVAQQALKFYVLLVSPELQEVVLQMLIELVKVSTIYSTLVCLFNS